MAWNCWYCKHFVMEEGGTGSWVGEEWVGVEEEGVFLRWLGSGGAGKKQGEEVVVGKDSWGIGLPFQALGEAVH